MEDVTLVNNATLCMNATRHDVGGVEEHHTQITTCHLAVMRNTTQQLYDAKCCVLECCVGSRILQQIVYVGDRSSCLQ